jgi:hypothetical protein
VNKSLAIGALALAAAFAAPAATASAETMPYLWPNKRAQFYNWHANYVYTDYGMPTSLVVPPTADLQTSWSWGAPSLCISRIDHQYTRDYPGPGPFSAARPFRYTPHWPQSTHQFGVYYVRGPWYPTQPDRVGKYGFGPNGPYGPEKYSGAGMHGKKKHFGGGKHSAGMYDCQP